MKEYFTNHLVLTKFNQGDSDTFLQVYDFYVAKLFRHAYYRISHKEAAQDLVQQVFLKTWQYLTVSREPIDNISAFLYKTTNNLIIDYYRKAERRNVVLDEELGQKLPGEPSNIVALDQDLDLAKIKQLLPQLSQEQQQLLLWRYVDDLSFSEIAKLCGKSKNAIYVGIFRALKKLKKLLANYEYL